MILRARDTYDYTFTEWIFGRTALFPDEEPELYPSIPLNSFDVAADVTRRRQQVVAAV